MDEGEFVQLCMCVLTPHLQGGQNNLFHRGEVGFPEELSLLSEGQDLVLVDGAHRCGNLQRTNGIRSVLHIAAEERLIWALKRFAVGMHLLLLSCHRHMHVDVNYMYM